MEGQIILVGYDDESGDKLLRVEHDKEIDVVRFPDLNVSVDRALLLAAILFLQTH